MKSTSAGPLAILNGTRALRTGALAMAVVASIATRAADAPPPGFRPNGEFMFRRLDGDNNGKLTREEFGGLAQMMPRLGGNSERAETMFARLDTNSDGTLTIEEFREFVQLMGRFPGRPPFAPNALPQPATPAVAEKPATPEGIAFFEKKIRPVLADKCYKCHSLDAEKVRGGLLVDTRDGLRKGGDSGSAVVPGDTKASLLIKAIHYADEDSAMPPKKEGGKLPEEVIADFEKWVQMGAPDPRDGKATLANKTIDLEKARQHWAFQMPKKTAPAKVTNPAWARSEIDRYILAELDKKNLKPVADPDKPTLLRRVYFDLIGLPPTPEEVERFVNDPSSSAFEKVVDTLLGSPQFGERWGRHWLDVARYAESSGKEANFAYPHAWRYRDYVINSFNNDKPYDLFLKEQLAGDLMPAADDTQRADLLVATGLLALGPKSHNTRNPRQFALDLADEQIDAVSQGMLGLTVACARCHDHKFDPVPQADYYAMAGIFLSTDTRFGTPRGVQNNNATSLIRIPDRAEVTASPPASSQQLAAMKRQLEQAMKMRDDILAEARGKNERPMGNPRLQGATTQIGVLEAQLTHYDENGKPVPWAMGALDRTFARDTQILSRGEFDKPGATVPRGVLQVLAPKEPVKIARGSGRLELANWIASPENPLTARVMANRVWLHLFDRGLVPTPDNFGTTGQAPSHPALLDYLALSFIEHGWSVKQLIREVVLSHTYQLSSAYDGTNYAADPDNVLHWRMNKRRLDAEAIRDGMLSVSGKMDLTAPKASAIANAEGLVLRFLLPIAARRFGGPMMGSAPANPLNPDQPIRSVYLPIVRDQVPDALAVFDFAEPSLVVGSREGTTVPSQALFLMNSTSVQKLAEAMADRLGKKKLSDTEFSKAAFQLAFTRSPTARELQAGAEFLKRFEAVESSNFPNEEALKRAGMVAFCQALLASAEFRYLN